VNALGLIETVGLPTAIAAADAAAKSANVQLHDYELTRGKGLVTVKFEGDVGAVTAALDAAEAVAQTIGEVYSKLVIARPDDQLEKIIKKEEDSEAVTEPLTETVGKVETEDSTESATGINETIETTEPDEPIDETPSEVEITVKSSGEEAVSPVVNLEKDICNLCHDPACSRRKGDLKALCIHYGN